MRSIAAGLLACACMVVAGCSQLDTPESNALEEVSIHNASTLDDIRVNDIYVDKMIAENVTFYTVTFVVYPQDVAKLGDDWNFSRKTNQPIYVEEDAYDALLTPDEQQGLRAYMRANAGQGSFSETYVICPSGSTCTVDSNRNIVTPSSDALTLEKVLNIGR